MSTYAVQNPATGEVWKTYPSMTDEEMEAVLATADRAFQEWRDTPIEVRAARLSLAADLHRSRREHLAALIVREMGKPYKQALIEVDFSADITQYYADNLPRLAGDQPLSIRGDGSALIRHAPLGPLLGIMPWNFPYYQVARFAAPNIAMGNTIILKHASQCPSSAEAIEQIYLDAGFPVGVYQNVFASNEQAAAIVADPRVQGVSVTGGEIAGAAVASQAGRNLKKVALELGGSDPFILLSTDNLAETVKAAVDARLDNNGQACNAPKRFIVVEELYDEFLDGFARLMAEAKLGDPLEAETVVGPVSSVAAAERLQAQIDAAVAQGARLVTGGPRNGAYITPTVLTDVTPEMDVYSEELFGPAAVVYRVADEDEAIRLANDTSFGLGSYVFTTDSAQAARVADRIEAGMVYVNVVMADSPELPFGGVKKSGTSRELGLLGADEFVNKKLIRVSN